MCLVAMLAFGQASWSSDFGKKNALHQKLIWGLSVAVISCCA